MEIQVGEYIRTLDGIKKIVKINEGNNATIHGKYIVEPKYKGSESINAKNIIKHSFNIIDLIEIEDLVNVIDGDTTAVCEVIGTGIRDKNFKKTNEIGVRYMSDEMDIIPLKRIKSIVTKEQFKAMEYEIK